MLGWHSPAIARRWCPDTTLAGAQVRVAGEYKTPWIDAMRPPNYLKAFGQLTRYVDDYRTKYGFLTHILGGPLVEGA
ncbi:hypothetical protein V8E54_008734 [Elaphomyces granulatus]